jgi:hypothetical protein
MLQIRTHFASSVKTWTSGIAGKGVSMQFEGNYVCPRYSLLWNPLLCMVQLQCAKDNFSELILTRKRLEALRGKFSLQKDERSCRMFPLQMPKYPPCVSVFS